MLITSTFLYANESLDYYHEHLLESSMNARYHSLPDIETSSIDESIRIKLGYSQFKGGPSDSKVFMSGIQKTITQNSSWNTIFFGFYDFSFIRTNNETVTADIIKNQSSPRLFKTQIILDGHQANSHHLGLGIGQVYRFQTNFALQAGILGEYYNIKNFEINFTTINEATNYGGSFNYDHTYLLYTPYTTLNWFPHYQLFGLQTIARLIITYPMPRKDLARTIKVGNQQFDLETSGKHIPDGFVGIGYALESPQKKWRIDIGSSLDFFLLEGSLMHKGIATPIFLNYSFIF